MTDVIKPAKPVDLAYWVSVHPALGVAPIDHLFRTFDGLYMARWRSNFRSDDDVVSWKGTWTNAFVEEGITPHEVKVGLVACRRDAEGWPPTLPQFLAMCRPAVNYEASYREAAQQLNLREEGKDSWSHPAIYWATVRIGAFDIRNGSFSAMKSRWVDALNSALADIRSGVLPNEVPARLAALPAPGKTMSREVAEANLAKIRSMMGGFPRVIPNELPILTGDANVLH